jgi:hypothetical protein
MSGKGVNQELARPRRRTEMGKSETERPQCIEALRDNSDGQVGLAHSTGYSFDGANLLTQRSGIYIVWAYFGWPPLLLCSG